MIPQNIQSEKAKISSETPKEFGCINCMRDSTLKQVRNIEQTF